MTKFVTVDVGKPHDHVAILVGSLRICAECGEPISFYGHTTVGALVTVTDESLDREVQDVVGWRIKDDSGKWKYLCINCWEGMKDDENI